MRSHARRRHRRSGGIPAGRMALPHPLAADVRGRRVSIRPRGRRRRSVEQTAMTCVRCGGMLKSWRGTHRYTEAGLSNVTLVGVEMRTCSRCGERELVTPHVDGLHRAIARTLSRQAAPLVPEAVRFLRKWLGLTAHELARVMGVSRETVCRWERVDAPCRLTPPADRLLKLLAAQHDGGGPYPIERRARVRRVKAAPIVLVSPDWAVAADATRGLGTGD